MEVYVVDECEAGGIPVLIGQLYFIWNSRSKEVEKEGKNERRGKLRKYTRKKRKEEGNTE